MPAPIVIPLNGGEDYWVSEEVTRVILQKLATLDERSASMTGMLTRLLAQNDTHGENITSLRTDVVDHAGLLREIRGDLNGAFSRIKVLEGLNQDEFKASRRAQWKQRAVGAGGLAAALAALGGLAKAVTMLIEAWPV